MNLTGRSRSVDGADGRTRTGTACATAPSRRRVYQFHHIGTNRTLIDRRVCFRCLSIPGEVRRDGKELIRTTRLEPWAHQSSPAGPSPPVPRLHPAGETAFPPAPPAWILQAVPPVPLWSFLLGPDQSCTSATGYSQEMPPREPQCF